jgi:hypothetical protein
MPYWRLVLPCLQGFEASGGFLPGLVAQWVYQTALRQSSKLVYTLLISVRFPTSGRV